MEDELRYQIEVTLATNGSNDHKSGIRQAVETALRRHKVRGATINILIVDDLEMARLHKTHLGQEGPTDVLAFDLGDDPITEHGKIEEARALIRMIEGEVVVSLDTARREASQRSHPVEAELALYAVHGTLHLLGYKDESEADAHRMHVEEDEILVEVGFGPTYSRSPKCE